MITNLIFNRIWHENYEPSAFYAELMDGSNEQITRVMDCGSEQDVKNELCAAAELEAVGYGDLTEYLPELKKYINSVNWL